MKKNTKDIKSLIETKEFSNRIPVLKTYKIYIGGKFPRTESGHFYSPTNAHGHSLGNICLCSRKDFRDAVVAARNAFGGWMSATAFNRSQVLYRIAEMLESRKQQFVEELILQGSTNLKANEEVNQTIDRIIYYAGWCDKYAQIFSSVNNVASSHFNFSLPEPVGVVGIIAPDDFSLLGFVSAILPVIAGGNTCIILASENKPLCAVSFAEVLNSSDVPGGVVNILSGKIGDLLSYFGNHLDVNAVIYHGYNSEIKKQLQSDASVNVKRIYIRQEKATNKKESENPYLILDTQEIKTTWHPIENIGTASGAY